MEYTVFVDKIKETIDNNFYFSNDSIKCLL